MSDRFTRPPISVYNETQSFSSPLSTEIERNQNKSFNNEELEDKTRKWFVSHIRRDSLEEHLNIIEKEGGIVYTILSGDTSHKVTVVYYTLFS